MARPGPVSLRGKLATRLLTVFALASILPILLTSLIAYRQMVRAAESRQARALREEAKDSALTLLAQLEVARAELATAAEAAAQNTDAMGSGVRTTADGFTSISIERLGSGAERSAQPAEMPPQSRRELQKGRTVLYWSKDGAAPRLLLARALPAHDRVAIGTLDTAGLLEHTRPPDASAVIALADTADTSAVIRPDRSEVPLAVLRALAASPTSGTASRPWSDALDEWRGAHWDLFLQGEFASAPLRMIVCESAADPIAGLSELRSTVPLSLLGAMLFSVLLAISQLRRYLGPLDTLTAATRRLGARDFDVEVRIDTHDELEALGESFNRMARALRHRVATLEAVGEVDRLLLATPNLEGILEALLPCMARVLQCSRVSVMLLDRDSSRCARLYEHAPAAAMPVTQRRIELDPGILEEVAATLSAADGSSEAPRVRGSMRDPFAGDRGGIAAETARTETWPLLASERLAGALHLAWDSPAAARETDDDAARGFADRLRVALVNLAHRDELIRQANFDGLTGLDNRSHFRAALAQRIAQCAKSGARSALLYVDLDDFKKVNDSAGHEAGDALLVEVAARLRKSCAADDIVARLGGDEFAIVLAAGADSRAATAAAQRILAVLSSPVVVAGTPRHISASIGVALIPDHGEDVALLLRNADIAMYRAKEQGRNRLALFAGELHDRMAARIELEVALQEAVAAGKLSLSYQPIMSGGSLVGVEALARWSRDSLGEVSPSVFIPIAEQSGLIVPLGRWVLQRACEDFARWRAAGIAPSYVSINVAPKQLETGQLVEELEWLIQMHDLLPSELQIEVTESAMAEGQSVVDTLLGIARIGVRLALDDFGTGYSSLSQLHHLPFDWIKIDRSFIAGLPGSGVARQLVSSILQMAHALDKLVVAEGVETEPQREFLGSIGCDAMQGYLFGRPVDEERMRDFLRTAGAEQSAAGADPPPARREA